MLVLSTLNQFDTIIKSPLNGNNLDILNSCRLRNYLTYVEKRELVRVSVFLYLATNNLRALWSKAHSALWGFYGSVRHICAMR